MRGISQIGSIEIFEIIFNSEQRPTRKISQAKCDIQCDEEMKSLQRVNSVENVLISWGFELFTERNEK